VSIVIAEGRPVNENAVLALVPAWNEATRIGPVVEATRAYLPVLVVDDGSQDDTSATAEAAGATVVIHPRNQGKGVALMTGFSWALDQDYQAVLTLDADGQHDPADIPRFLCAYADNAGDLIIGRRDFAQMPFPRRYSNPAGSWLLSLALGARIQDNQSGYRLHTRRLLQVLDPTATGFELEVEVIAQTLENDMRLAWVEIRTIYGTGKKSYFHPITDSAGFLAMVWRLYRRRVTRSRNSQ
jgi:glycosyltransferase involved in cell wall biosynthesis